MSAVEVTLTNRYAYVTEATDEDYEAISEWWSFFPPGYRFSPKYVYGGWDGRIKMMRDGRLPAGLFRATKKDLARDLGLSFKVKLDLPKANGTHAPEASLDPKYQYQEECVLNMLEAMRRGGGIILSATGSGKTAIAGKFFKCLSDQCLFVVDDLGLLYQSQKEIAEWSGEPVGLVGNSKFLPQRLTAATIQTLHKHRNDLAFRKWFKKIKVVIIDELHEQMSKRNFKILDTISPIACYGLTATLQLKRKEIRMRAYSFAGPVIYEFPLQKGIEAGVLTNGRVLQLAFEYEPIPEESYLQSYEAQVWDNEAKLTSMARVVRYLIKEGHYVIVLVDKPLHVRALHSKLLDVPHRMAFGAIDPERRRRSKKKFEKGDVQLIIANRVFKKGINVKRVDVLIDMAELKSKNDAQQKFGRGVRLHPDKTELLYIDVTTQGENRYTKAGKSRARAIRAMGIKIKRVEVDSPLSAVAAVKKELKIMMREETKKKCHNQTEQQDLFKTAGKLSKPAK
jgi:superfamily II DNA or RNA helicase